MRDARLDRLSYIIAIDMLAYLERCYDEWCVQSHKTLHGIWLFKLTFEECVDPCLSHILKVTLIKEKTIMHLG